MATTRKKKPAAKSEPAPVALPAAVLGMLTKDQVALALGVSVRTIDTMIAGDEFPHADCEVRSLPRWSVQRFNEWVADQIGKPSKRRKAIPPHLIGESSSGA